MLSIIVDPDLWELKALCCFCGDNYFNFCQAVCFVDYFQRAPAPTTHKCIVAPCRFIRHQIDFLAISTQFTTTFGTILLRCLCSAAFSHFHNNSLPLVVLSFALLMLRGFQPFTTIYGTILRVAYAPRLWATFTR
jgi:hypothetical protein